MTDRTCSIDDCDRKPYGRGWCKKHYMQWHRSPDRESIHVVRRPDCCTVEGCDKPVKTRELCAGHRQRLARYGSPTGAPQRATAAERFWSRVSEAPTGCWLWVGPTQVGGYGKFRDGTKTTTAHRWSYIHLVGDAPDGLHLDHLCNTPACVNPYHLDPVTPAVNNQRRNARYTTT